MHFVWVLRAKVPGSFIPNCLHTNEFKKNPVAVRHCTNTSRDPTPRIMPTQSKDAWLPTCTMATKFYALPKTNEGTGRVVGIDQASSLSGDQTGMRIVGYGLWVSPLLQHCARCRNSVALYPTASQVPCMPSDT